MKILVVDDHPLIQEALTQLLPQLRDDIEVLNAVTADEATGILDDEPEVSLVLLDLALPGTRGLDLLSDLMQDYPGVPVVVLSATHDRATVNAAFAAGARGFIAKTSDPRELLEAVRLVCEGGEYLTPDITLVPDGDGVRIAPGALGLTTRQADVLMLLVQGKPNKLACFTG